MARSTFAGAHYGASIDVVFRGVPNLPIAGFCGTNSGYAHLEFDRYAPQPDCDHGGIILGLIGGSWSQPTYLSFAAFCDAPFYPIESDVYDRRVRRSVMEELGS